MKKVTAFVGSARRKYTYDAVRRFLDHLQAMGEVESEIVCLSDYRLEMCRGCKLCFEKGEQACPLKDDRDVLIEKMTASDGVIFASPSYMFQVSAITKTFLDRLAFFGHRPHFFGKTFTSIVIQGLPFDAKITKYLDFVGACVGFNVVKGSCFTSREPMTEAESRKLDALLARQSRRFYERLMKPDNPVPPLIMLMGFRIGRTTMKVELDDRSLDYRYYRDKGWLDADYFYPTHLGPLRKLVGRLFDAIGARMARKRAG